MTLTPALPSMGASAINKKTTTAAAVFGVIFFHAAIAIIVFAIFGNLDIVGTAQVLTSLCPVCSDLLLRASSL